MSYSAMSRSRALRWVLVGLLALLTSGCAMFGDDDDPLAPAPLTRVDAEYDLRRVWSAGIGNGQGKLYHRLRPAVSDGRVVAASNNGRVAAFDLQTGKTVWRANLKVELHGGVGLGNGLALVSSADGQIHALDAATGEVRWRGRVNSEVLAPPQAADGVVVAQSFDGRLTGFDASTGNRLWSYAAGAPVLTLRTTSTPLIHEGAVLAGFANGKVVAVDIRTGKAYWETRVATPTGSSEIERLVDIAGEMLVDDNVLYVVAYQGDLTALDLRSGRRLWAQPASSHVGLGEGFNNVYVATAEGSVLAFRQGSGSQRWEQSALARRQLSGAAALGNVVAVGDMEGYLHLLSQSDGRIVGRRKVDGDGIRVAPVVAGDLLIVFGNGGKLVAYRVEAK
ncbi:MAG: outer membrane protein assembly factor BamB [Spongiibacteraceae bacterium]|jgi:outer membrane protein assembly factor BamB|nr:outer membrane protein assembly factor BamB [Spongiibacteraceae bacterium]